ncbi:MAG: DUF6152 family protein [Caulobacteraceae bacterium]
MKKAIVAVAAIALAGSWASLASAHHSAAQFDFTKSVQVKGTVKEFNLINPHMQLVLHVTDAKGARDIEYEGHSRNNMYRAGWRANMVKPGEALTINIAPLRTGTDGGYVTSATTADGRKFGMQSSALATQAAAEAK